MIAKKTLVDLLPPDANIIEIGSHRGVDTEEFAVLFPKGEVFGFEPVPQLFLKAMARVEGLKNATLFPCGVGASKNFAMFNVSSGMSDALGSLLRPTLHLQRHPGVTFDKGNRIFVPVIDLDSFTEAMGLESIALIWMDVQGAEGDVVLGATKTLKIVSFVYTEVSTIPVFEGQAPYEKLKLQMFDQGFSPALEFFPPSWGGEGNVLFERGH